LQQLGGRHRQAIVPRTLGKQPLIVQRPQALQRLGQHRALGRQRGVPARHIEQLFAGRHQQVNALGAHDVEQGAHEAGRVPVGRRHAEGAAHRARRPRQRKGHAFGQKDNVAGGVEHARQLQGGRRAAAGEENMGHAANYSRLGIEQ
jgi:hypothetical protein